MPVLIPTDSVQVMHLGRPSGLAYALRHIFGHGRDTRVGILVSSGRTLSEVRGQEDFLMSHGFLPVSGVLPYSTTMFDPSICPALALYQDHRYELTFDPPAHDQLVYSWAAMMNMLFPNSSDH